MSGVQGSLLRDEALDRLEDAHTLWLEGAVLVIARVAHALPRLTSDDVWQAMPATLHVDEPRALGAAMRHAERDGTIRPTATWVLSTRAVCHRRPLRVWESLVWR